MGASEGDGFGRTASGERGDPRCRPRRPLEAPLEAPGEAPGGPQAAKAEKRARPQPQNAPAPDLGPSAEGGFERTAAGGESSPPRCRPRRPAEDQGEARGRPAGLWPKSPPPILWRSIIELSFY